MVFIIKSYYLNDIGRLTEIALETRRGEVAITAFVVSTDLFYLYNHLFSDFKFVKQSYFDHNL